MRKIFTFLLALAASVGMSWADTYVTITQNDFPASGRSFTKDGVTVSADNIDPYEGNLLMSGTFTTTLGNFTKIEVNAGDVDISGEGWSGDYERMTWTGNASSVSFSGDIRSKNQGVTIMFTIGDPAPTYTVALKAGTANADKVTLSATSAVEGATITVTPNEEYEITAFKATYNTTEELSTSFNAETGAYSFTMPAYAVTIEATIALKPVPEGDVFAGFTATAGSGGFDNEGHANLVDNKFISSNWTKWCTNDDKKSVPTGESEKCWWLDFEASAALNLTGYILTTGNDTGSEHGRNPKNWLLKAKLNADDAWTTIATVTNDVTMKNQSFKDYKFFVDQSGPYQYFRFEVFANQGAGVMQLCELRLVGTEASEPVLATAYTLQLHVNDAAMGSVAVTNLLGSDIFDNGDGTYDVPEGASVTLQATPNEGYEFSGWKASSTLCDFAECEFVDLKRDDNPLTFDVYADAAFLAEFKAVAPQPTVWTALAVGDVIKLGDKIEVPAEGDGWGINGNILRNAWGPYTLIRADIVQEHEYDDPVVTEAEDGAYYVFKAENDDFYPLSNLGKGTGLVVTETSDGLVVTNVGDLGMPVFTVAVHDNGGATAIDEISQEPKAKSQKLIRNGQLLIERDGKTYNIIGTMIQ